MHLMLKVFGPIEIPFDSQPNGPAKQVAEKRLSVFWDKPEASAVATKHGCYVFSLRAAKGFTPWYVGKASSYGLRWECFRPYQLKLYNGVLFNGGKGTPVMFFIASPGGKNKLREKTLDDLETFLIQSAKYKNHKLSNVQKTKNLPDWGITGVVRSRQGKPKATASAFKKMMKL